MKKLLTLIASVTMLIMAVSGVKADGTTTTTEETVCTTGQYGSQTCTTTKKETTVHKPVDAALGDYNPALVIGGLMALGYGTLTLSKKVQA